MTKKPNLEIKYEGKRGCGYRRPGGMYLVSDQALRPCGRMPILLEVCSLCGSGIRPSRQWIWIDGDQIVAEAKKIHCLVKTCGSDCPLFGDFSFGRSGLLWIGERFYPTPDHFMKETRKMGISRRINFVPHGFKLGETWVFLAHRKIPDPEKKKPFIQGIFQIFRPQKIEIVCSGEEDEKTIADYRKRGLTPVIIKKIEEQESIDEDLDGPL